MSDERFDDARHFIELWHDVADSLAAHMDGLTSNDIPHLVDKGATQMIEAAEAIGGARFAEVCRDCMVAYLRKRPENRRAAIATMPRTVTLPSGIKYTRCDWGDLIEGSKAQLQALGLGVGRAFPREPGGPRGLMPLRVRDPRGFACEIRAWDDDPIAYSAHLEFPGWPRHPRSAARWTHYAPGIKSREGAAFDEYRGSAEALAAAGLIRAHQLPGAPGMAAFRVCVLSDGVVAKSGAANGMGEPGARRIERASKSTFRVCVIVAPEVEERRRKAAKAAEVKWLETVRALPRPAMLTPEVIGFESARTAATNDQPFQKALQRIVAGARRGGRGGR